MPISRLLQCVVIEGAMRWTDIGQTCKDQLYTRMLSLRSPRRALMSFIAHCTYHSRVTANSQLRGQLMCSSFANIRGFLYSQSLHDNVFTKIASSRHGISRLKTPPTARPTERPNKGRTREAKARNSDPQHFHMMIRVIYRRCLGIPHVAPCPNLHGS